MRQEREDRNGWRAFRAFRAICGHALATLGALALLVAAGLWGGIWLAAALIWLMLLPLLRRPAAPPAEPPLPARATETAADLLSALLGLAHLPLLALAVAAIAGITGLSPIERAAAFLAFGLHFGLTGNANAHELIHRSNRFLFNLGRLHFTSLLFGHHASAHRLVHHVHVATDADPNSAPAGMSFWRFLPRAWLGSFAEGLKAENRLRHRKGTRPSGGLHPYALHVGGGIGALLLPGWLAGPAGTLALLALGAYATLQLLLSDYVQHYGLRRATGPDGRPEPAGPAHSWDAPEGFAGLLSLNAGRHADHHSHPARPWPALESAPHTPRLPYPLPLMGAIALWPRRWHRLMDRRLPPAAASNGPALETKASMPDRAPAGASGPLSLPSLLAALTIPALAALALIAAPALAEGARPTPAQAEGPLEDAAAFDAATLGRTIHYAHDGTPFGIEQYLPDHRVIWAFEGGECQRGSWEVSTPGIVCFTYETRPDAPSCWRFSTGPGGISASLVSDDGESFTLREYRRDEAPLFCPGPKVGA